MPEVAATKHQAEIALDQTEFDEKRKINKRKKLIQNGLTEEEADKILEKKDKKNAELSTDDESESGDKREKVKRKKQRKEKTKQ